MSKKNSRPCPALQRDITSKECGSDRHSRIPCPAECPFNPFAPDNYDELKSIESAAEKQAHPRLNRSMSPARQAAFSARIESVRHDLLKLEACFIQEYFQRPGPDGLSFLSQWEAEGWTGLNNDQRVYYNGHRQLSPRLIEYQGSRNAGQSYGLDILNPTAPPLLFMDRSLAAKLPRFSTVIFWHFPLPHFHRLFGVNVQISPLGHYTLLETVQEVVQHLGGPSDLSQVLHWLSIHFARFVEALHASADAVHAARMRHLDYRLFQSTWQYSCPLEVLLNHCNASPLLTGDWPTEQEKKEHSCIAAYDLFAPSSDLALFQAHCGANVMGRLLIAKGSVTGIALGEANQNHLRSTVEHAAGAILSRIAIKIDKLPNGGATSPAYDRALVPPRLEEAPPPLVFRKRPHPFDDPENGDTSYKIPGEILTGSYRAFVDATPPELGGLTVQAAAALPLHRAAVALIIKNHVNSIDRLRKEEGYVIDIDDLILELGFPELIYEQPAGLYTGKRQRRNLDETT